MQWFEGQLIAIRKSPHDRDFGVYEIVSWHPDGVLLRNKEGFTTAYDKKAFEESKPFPVGYVKVTRHCFLGESRNWIYGQQKNGQHTD